MEKYIIILVILATIYYIQSKLKETEGFADVPAQSLGGVDDTNAINTLAQIAKNLMTGGVTIPGAINLSNSKSKFTLINDPDNCFRIKDDRGAQVLAINDGGSIYSKGDGFILSGNDLILKGNQSIGGSLTVNGDFKGNWSTDQENGFKMPYHCWMKVAKTDGGQDPYKLLFENSGKTVLRSPNGFEFRNPQDQVLYRVDRIHGPQLSELFRITNQQWKYVLFSSDGNALNCNGNGNFDMTWQNNPEYFWYQRGSRIFNYKYPNKCMTITGDRGWNRDTFVNLTDFDPNNAHQCWTWSWAGCIVTSSCSNGEGNPVPALKNGWITKMRCRQDGRIDIWDWNGGADCNFWKW